ncbi:MAG: prevent-host-death protein [Acidocella sp. 20-57-95]|nr:MAG: prevent-host-death protein [Acidocella sp. 20-57-95]OYV61601.1 MAG: prevent-host-death protein [Acidocella sp. 21-58-7]HQT64251.1 type II toxin-antitoxin system prevent-host-death family antitoxin [Acidocella sp.]HQU04677.1 type II toxin-antitoxin system prevent-host-death family antitoxin [Acidocella sp.]
MMTVNIHEAKTHLSRLVEAAAKGEGFIIAKAGKPMVKVMPLEDVKPAAIKRLGFMKGQISVPDDIKTPFAKDIEEMFGL